jgi:hypothetical protein
MLFTKEFYDMMEVFERTSKEFLRTGNMGLTREPKENWSRQYYYSDGNANEAFRIFLNGYSLGKSLTNPH